ncbi:MAG: LytTR family DNA-binding domain-containing protein [Paracoccaceae bacterium]
MPAFLTEYGADFRTPVPFVVWAVLTVIVGFSGPFNSYDLPVLTRFLFWGSTIALAIVLGGVVRAFVHGSLGLRDFHRGSVLIACIITVLFAPPLHFLVHLLFEAHPPHPTHLPHFAEVAGFIFVVSLGVGAFRHSIGNVPKVRQARAEPPVLPRLLQRIEPCVRGELISISVRDHYVDVKTSGGQSSLLMRFCDAVAEVEGVAGTQVHRSHWVAWSAVQGVERAEGKLLVRMACGARLPVSKNHRAKLAERGLI